MDYEIKIIWEFGEKCHVMGIVLLIWNFLIKIGMFQRQTLY